MSPLTQHWFDPSNVRTLLDPVTMHPNTAGHASYSGRLASALSGMTVTK